MVAALKEDLAVVARAARGGLVQIERAAEALSLSRRVASARLAGFVRRGWLTRVRRGLYLVLPLEALPSGSTTLEDPWVLARELFGPCYIGGWTAAEHWGLTEQIFRSTFVVTAASVRRKSARLLGVEFRIARVRRDRLEGVDLVWRGPERVPVSSRERTIADALSSPTWVGGIRHLADIMRAYRESREWNPDLLLRTMMKYGRGAAFKRFGFMIETMFPDAGPLVEGALTRRSAGIVKLDPAVSRRGKLVKRWGLWVNATVGQSTESE